MDSEPKTPNQPVLEVFLAFLKLGLTSFGGPAAHMSFFRLEFVERRRWFNDDQFAQLLAVCQFLPGPASSQLGFSLGLLRAGLPGALAAFIAFTTPSVIVLLTFASLLPLLTSGVGEATIQGLKLLALAVVAHGTIGMAHQLCPDWQRRSLALLATVATLGLSHPALPIMVVATGAIAGLLCCRHLPALSSSVLNIPYSARSGWSLLALFALLLITLPMFAKNEAGYGAVANAFYQAGALVFGGGHVVLPFLKSSLVNPGWISSDQFLAGYGVAQLIPGPIFTFAAYLGSILPAPSGGGLGAAIALSSIFLPGFLLIAGALPLWGQLSKAPAAARGIAGVNAAVVGLLAAALYDPLFTNSVSSVADLLIAGGALLLLTALRLSILWAMLWCIGTCLLRYWATA